LRRADFETPAGAVDADFEPKVLERRAVMARAGEAVNSDYDCSRVVEIEHEPRHHLVLANEHVRAFAVEILPHEVTLCHHHPYDYLLYVAGGAEIVSAARDEEPKLLNYSDGECELSSAGLVHVVENLSDHPFRNVVVELLLQADGLRRGAVPTVIRRQEENPQSLKEANVMQLFGNDRAVIFSIEIDPGAEVAISGPAVVAAPFADKLGPDAFGDVEVKRDPICDLAWIAPEQEAVLYGCWKQTAMVIVFQVGGTDEQETAVSEVREPVKSLRAHADELEG
jgi:quercetin dioxygenase-like cupin family protein